jgi:DNA polymerase III subunit chi
MDSPGLSQVEFHTGVEEPIVFARRLLRKAVRSGARVLVTAPAPVLAELDRSLWTFEERDFLPHVRMPGTSASVAARTPLWLATDASAVTPSGTQAGTQAGAQAGAQAKVPRVVLNLGAAAPIDLSAIQRLIEIVSADADEAQNGRERWRQYKAAGLNVVHHKAGLGRET